MKIPKSIKWRLQIWYGLILVIVLAGVPVYFLWNRRAAAAAATDPLPPR